MSTEIAMSNTGSPAEVRERRLLVDVLARMAKVFLDQHRNMPVTPVESKGHDRSCPASQHSEAQEVIM
jgi:hypothetical protein